jgi:hypothetical protein
MSSVLVIAPVVVASWPAISAAVTAAIGTMGFSVARASVTTASTTSTLNRANIDVEESEILAGTAGTEQKIVIERDGVRATFSRDARGRLKLCVEGSRLSDAELRKIGEEVMGRVTQRYVYGRIVAELEQRHVSIVDEHVCEDQSVKIRVRLG